MKRINMRPEAAGGALEHGPAAGHTLQAVAVPGAQHRQDQPHLGAHQPVWSAASGLTLEAFRPDVNRGNGAKLSFRVTGAANS